MGVTTTKTNKPFNPRGNDQSPKGYNRAALYSGKALDFDGVNDNVGITSATDLWTGDFSVSWYGNLDATGNYFAFSSGTYTGSGQAGINVWYGGASNTNFSAHFPESDGTGQQGYNLTLAESYEYWHRIDLVFVSSSRLLSLYQNGILVDTATIASNVDAAYMPNGWEFGRSYGGSFPLNGKLTNLKAFNTALTAAQVADLYNNPEKVVPTGVDNTALKLWLPMMEGAGTTAYDGSGNGNHGTIAGATYVNGVGAPSPQSAVMDWNKNKNSITNSADFSAAAGWSSLISGTGTAVVTNNYAESPYGGQTAARLQAAKNTGYGVMSFTPAVSTSGTYVSSIWAKSNTGSTQNVAMYSRNSASQYQSVTTEWTRIEFTGSAASNYFNIGALSASDASIDILLWGAQMVLDASEAGPYIPTIGTAQTSEVLLPQGLTTGRDITGVNLFENVRKQGALNLDGNSWAEVHDNESLDFGSGSWTLEAWVDFDDSNQKGILSRWYGSARAVLLYKRTDRISLYSGQSSGTGDFELINSGSISNGWKHIVGTYDSSDTKLRIYLDGSLNATSAAFPNAYNSNTNTLEIGRHNDSSLNSYPNDIAQPRIYNRALTASEIQQNYNAGKNTYTN